eukprot:13217414-Ditylum_brightwellii.AAC.1
MIPKDVHACFLKVAANCFLVEWYTDSPAECNDKVGDVKSEVRIGFDGSSISMPGIEGGLMPSWRSLSEYFWKVQHCIFDGVCFISGDFRLK